MYVLLEYLTYLAVVSVVGLALFGATALGLAAKEEAAKLKQQTSAKLPRIATRLSLGHLADLADWRHHTPPAQIQ